MSPIEYILIAIIVAIVALFYMIITKDTQQSQKIRAIASVVERSQQELYKLDKKIEQELVILSETIPSDNSLHVTQTIHTEIQAVSEALAIALKDIEESFEGYNEKQENRLSKLESNIKSLIMPTSISGIDDEKIITLFNQGISLETIAKELRISKAEVEFVLKINQLQ